ncbi:hypothetical protein A1O1_01471 [Capronia coronata CBS 617.96]|uniref:F-box domain-containing protein n=1 Tax=Capronia coronata CBS 617.96 TaxID=1182541 RepID=W9Z331_9EURO|nr:uncharacterized protein A1O1_01471 [Capronia coronata CBS 617.96]EXJ96345.1 hypothetical protein A1O1_01471 [Capronia coronata CBS 617.96]
MAKPVRDVVLYNPNIPCLRPAPRDPKMSSTGLAPVFARKHQGFALPRSALPPAGRRGRKLQVRRSNAVVYNPTKPTLAGLPNEVLDMVFENLDVPSRISLGLVNKFFASMSQNVSTDLTDQPSVVRYHEHCQALPCLYTNHISDRRILLLQLKSWMPRGFRLCWVCLKYTRITRDNANTWTFTTRVRFDGFCRLNLLALIDLRDIHAHKSCCRGGIELASYANHTPGASGGFIRFGQIHAPPSGVHIYNAGF